MKRSIHETEKIIADRKRLEAARPRLDFWGVVLNAVPPKMFLDLALALRPDFEFREDYDEHLVRQIEKLLEDLPSNQRALAVERTKGVCRELFKGVIIDDNRQALVAWSVCVLKMVDEGLIYPKEVAVMLALMVHGEAEQDGEVWGIRDWKTVHNMAGRLMDALLSTDLFLRKRLTN